jgi:hypothetical protein
MCATKRKKNNVDRSFAFFLSIIASSFLVDYQKTGFFLLVLSRSFLHSYRVRQATKKEITIFLMSV